VAVAPLEFHTWYNVLFIIDRGLKCYFPVFFANFRSFLKIFLPTPLVSGYSELSEPSLAGTQTLLFFK